MSKEEIKERFKQTKLGKKIFKRFKKTLILFIISHVLMLLSLVLFVPNISKLISGKLSLMPLLFGGVLLVSAICSLLFGIFLVYYDGKIVGCVELFDLMLKARAKKNN